LILIKRLARIVIAYLVAAAATGVVLAALHFVLPTYTELMRTGIFMEFISLAWGFFVMVSFFACAFALWVIVLGEWFSVRSIFYYAFGGALIGLLLGTVLREQPWFPYAGVGQGLVAGAIYWRIAGKTSGMLERHMPLMICLLVMAFTASFVFIPALLGMPRLSSILG
jgi:hypothetical protein